MFFLESISITDHEIKEKTEYFVCTVIDEISKDPINNIIINEYDEYDETPGNRVKKIAEFIRKTEKDMYLSICEKIMSYLVNIIKESNILTGVGEESLWKKVHLFMQKTEFKYEWKSFIS